MKILSWQLEIQTCARFGSWSQSRSWSVAGSRAWAGSGSLSVFGSGSWVGSQIETCQLLIFRTQDENLKITDISALDLRIFSSKQKQLGFKLKGNQLEVGQEFENISSKIIESGIPILALKEVEIMSGFRKRKMNFCLAGEELWLVFQ